MSAAKSDENISASRTMSRSQRRANLTKPTEVEVYSRLLIVFIKKKLICNNFPEQIIQLSRVQSSEGFSAAM